MKNLNKYINQYANAEELKGILHLYGIDELLNRMLKTIDDLSEKNPLDITKWAGTILTSINEKLRLISRNEDKEKMEYLFADLFQGFIENVLAKSQKPSLALSEIYDTLKITCELNEYDFDTLVTVLGLNKHKHILKLSSTFDKRHYSWNKTQGELKELASDVKNKGWIKSSSEFYKLCMGDEKLKEFRVLEKGKEMLLLLFDKLYGQRIISVKGGKGHFSPLVSVAVGDNGQYLYEKKVNKYHESLKRDKLSYLKKFNEIDKLIRINIKDEDGQ